MGKLSSLTEIKQPNWWPADISYEDNTLMVDNDDNDGVSKIRRVITECYQYYKAEFLLHLSARLMNYYKETNTITVVDDVRGLRKCSLIDKDGKEFSVKFTAENQDYDKFAT